MKNIKFPILFFSVAFAFLFHLASAKVVNISSLPVRVETGESFRLLSIYSTSNSSGWLHWKFLNENGDANQTVYIASAPGRDDPNGNFLTNPFIIEGPGWLESSSASVSVEILPTAQMQKHMPGGGVGSAQPANQQNSVTVIPENSSGNVNIILEQSTDLVNWTAVDPGSFAPSTAKRFFRVRAQQQ